MRAQNTPSQPSPGATGDIAEPNNAALSFIDAIASKNATLLAKLLAEHESFDISSLIDKQQIPALVLASMNADLACLKLLLTRLSVEQVNNQKNPLTGGNALLTAAYASHRSNYMEIVEELVAYGADCNCAFPTGLTVLHCLAYRNQGAKAAQLITEDKADPCKTASLLSGHNPSNGFYAAKTPGAAPTHPANTPYELAKRISVSGSHDTTANLIYQASQKAFVLNAAIGFLAQSPGEIRIIFSESSFYDERYTGPCVECNMTGKIIFESAEPSSLPLKAAIALRALQAYLNDRKLTCQVTLVEANELLTSGKAMAIFTFLPEKGDEMITALTNLGLGKLPSNEIGRLASGEIIHKLMANAALRVTNNFHICLENGNPVPSMAGEKFSIDLVKVLLADGTRSAFSVLAKYLPQISAHISAQVLIPFLPGISDKSDPRALARCMYHAKLDGKPNEKHFILALALKSADGKAIMGINMLHFDHAYSAWVGARRNKLPCNFLAEQIPSAVSNRLLAHEDASLKTVLATHGALYVLLELRKKPRFKVDSHSLFSDSHCAKKASPSRPPIQFRQPLATFSQTKLVTPAAITATAAAPAASTPFSSNAYDIVAARAYFVMPFVLGSEATHTSTQEVLLNAQVKLSIVTTMLAEQYAYPMEPPTAHGGAGETTQQETVSPPLSYRP